MIIFLFSFIRSSQFHRISWFLFKLFEEYFRSHLKEKEHFKVPVVLTRTTISHCSCLRVQRLSKCFFVRNQLSIYLTWHDLSIKHCNNFWLHVCFANFLAVTIFVSSPEYPQYFLRRRRMGSSRSDIYPFLIYFDWSHFWPSTSTSADSQMIKYYN